MKNMIKTDRLAKRFTELVQIDSMSLEERDVAKRIEEILKPMGAEIFYDNAKEALGGNCSNLIAKFPGTVDTEPIFLSGHMDTVGPGKGIKVIFKDNIFKSDGTTILGSDDKSAIAIILEVMDVIIENKIDYPPVELVFTICEEIGLLGAKHLDYALLDSKFGYILDALDTGGIITKAPAANKLTVRVYGRAAHAGRPETGINAITAASKAISRVQLGRLDEETTCNFGKIKGGVATNIVPELVEINGEVRSHDQRKLEKVTKTIVDIFENTIREIREGNEDLPRVECLVDNDFPNTDIPEDHRVITLARKAAENIGIGLKVQSTGGGADANIFVGKGIMAGVLGTGMTDVHTLNESIDLRDMVKTARLVLEILRLHAQAM